MRRRGAGSENFLREWSEEPFASELWHATEALEACPSVAVATIRSLADRDSPLAMMYLAEGYLFGFHGLDREIDTGLAWAHRSIELGSIEANLVLARFLLRSGDFEEAAEVLTDMERKNFSPAICKLALLHNDKNIENASQDEAMRLFRKAESLGHLHARHWLAVKLIENADSAKGIALGLAKFLSFAIGMGWQKMVNPRSDKLRL